jgi:aspartyl-tRNA(Asn)/glutamyl-tRNA(Gln) amidotransferase subunit B
MMPFETVIGLEVHVQLGTRSKLFSAAPVGFGGEPNTRVLPQDLGLPGTLPVLNARAVELAVRAALALEGEVQKSSQFARKNYFYPDLPKGYQISQYEQPLCVGGRVPLGDGRCCALQRIHVEEDAGKSTHAADGSLVDYNRAGVPLIEIVSAPDLREPADAHRFLEQLKRILQYAGVSDCDMEKGSLRCDANISLRPRGETRLGSKVEIKNLNSFRMVQRALEYEQRRQSAILAAGGEVPQETRLWNDESGETGSLRSKESAQDYRYFPDPDLPPLQVGAELVLAARQALPELPLARRARLQRDFALPEYDADVLTQSKEVADYFEQVARACGDGKAASNWVMTEVLRVAHETGTPLSRLPVTASRLAALIAATKSGRVSLQAGKKVFAHMLAHDQEPLAALATLGLEQISDVDQLRAVVRQVLGENRQAVAEWRAGKDKALNALKGRIMRATGGKANPAVVDDLLRELAT